MPEAPADVVQRYHDAFHAGDRATVERLLADDFVFTSPDDPHLDRAGWFERCWTHRGLVRSHGIDRVFTQGDEVVISYEAEREGAPRFRNAELIRVAEGRIRAVEVFYGAARQA